MNPQLSAQLGALSSCSRLVGTPSAGINLVPAKHFRIALSLLVLTALLIARLACPVLVVRHIADQLARAGGVPSTMLLYSSQG